jgi:hypothetical protein
LELALFRLVYSYTTASTVSADRIAERKKRGVSSAPDSITTWFGGPRARLVASGGRPGAELRGIDSRFSRRRIDYCLLFLPVALSEKAMRRDRDCAKMARLD